VAKKREAARSPRLLAVPPPTVEPGSDSFAPAVDPRGMIERAILVGGSVSAHAVGEKFVDAAPIPISQNQLRAVTARAPQSESRLLTTEHCLGRASECSFPPTSTLSLSGGERRRRRNHDCWCDGTARTSTRRGGECLACRVRDSHHQRPRYFLPSGTGIRQRRDCRCRVSQWDDGEDSHQSFFEQA
jgi:hypothetical protein